MLSDSAIEILVVGYGYWGPNVVRNVMERPEFRLTGVCERDEQRIEDFSSRYPGIDVERSFDAALADPNIEAVAIATPPAHALRAGVPCAQSRQARFG